MLWACAALCSGRLIGALAPRMDPAGLSAVPARSTAGSTRASALFTQLPVIFAASAALHSHASRSRHLLRAAPVELRRVVGNRATVRADTDGSCLHIRLGFLVRLRPAVRIGLALLRTRMPRRGRQFRFRDRRAGPHERARNANVAKAVRKDFPLFKRHQNLPSSTHGWASDSLNPSPTARHFITARFVSASKSLRHPKPALPFLPVHSRPARSRLAKTREPLPSAHPGAWP